MQRQQQVEVGRGADRPAGESDVGVGQQSRLEGGLEQILHAAVVRPGQSLHRYDAPGVQVEQRLEGEPDVIQ
ncbi:hypothetical protein GCM10010178_80860 [Lentzea flava]|uniref:Uncharacterized protein n=1 Tax=Lentzea flava TaxID=103732 RepID=A0ABQ2VCZ2_9PSEU|nr:hypothetical protein GCM10010178_80860 [Lentzea flava]